MKKIICFRNSKLGDYIVSIPALELIRKKNPNCKIFYLLAQNRFSPDLPKEIENNKIVDEFIYFKHNFIRSCWNHYLGYTNGLDTNLCCRGN